MGRHAGAPVLVPSWYAEMLGEGFEATDRAIEGNSPRWLVELARRVPAIRGILAFHRARDRPGSAVILGDPGTATVLFLEAWARRRRAVVVLELIPRRPDRRIRRALHRAWSRTLLAPAIRRAMTAGHILSEGERDAYAEELAVPPARLVTIPWARSSGVAEREADGAPPRAGVLASGRAWTDWETLFAAARGREWPLTVVYGERYRQTVPRLNHDGRARQLCEIAPSEHAELLRRAAVYVIPLRADSPSAGQVRLMAATDAGAAVVATRIAPLAGYVSDGVSAVLVEPGDPDALAAAVERLLSSPDERERLVAGARERARRWTYREYFDAVGELLHESLTRVDK